MVILQNLTLQRRHGGRLDH